MFTLRCTRKLSQRLRTLPRAEDARATTTLGDWYANLVYLSREQVVLFVNERSLLPVLVPAKNASSLIARFAEAVCDVFLRLGVAPVTVEAEVREMQEAGIGKTMSRRVLGSMTDFTLMLRWAGGRGRSSTRASIAAASASSRRRWRDRRRGDAPPASSVLPYRQEP